MPPHRTCLLTDDGSLTTSRLAQILTQRGWQVIVLSFPQANGIEHLPLPQGVKRITLTDFSEEQLQEQLVIISETYGLIGAFIHLHPVDQDRQLDKTFLESDKTVAKSVFLLAKHLKKSLNQLEGKGRNCFLTVVRLDGELGLGKRIDFSAIRGGLSGLTKTLNLEWKEVFCRAIDLSPELDAEQSAQAIVAELHDPNSLILEVGYSLQGRATLVCETTVA